MRAIGVKEYGGPEVLQEVDLPAEALGAGQVRLRVTAAAVNPADIGVRTGWAGTGWASRTGHPEEGVDVPGLDVAGVVTDVGQGVSTGVAIGDRVMGTVVWSGTHGAYREDIALPARSVVAVPAGATDVEAATLPLNGLTALQALDLLSLDPGRVLAVTGAVGAVGGYVVQLAKVAGLTVVADASEADEDLLRTLGADVVVRRGPDLAERFRGQFPDGVDGLVDVAALDAAILPAVRDGGAVATVRGYAGDGKRGLRVTPVIVSTYAEEWEKLDRLRRLAEEGKVTLRVAGTYPAEQAAEAHRRFEAGGVRGRLVLVFD
jgi:NADPH:quinone reductase-like Zn-dependent oxidoreductase